jgi:hypothetical protein
LDKYIKKNKKSKKPKKPKKKQKTPWAGFYPDKRRWNIGTVCGFFGTPETPFLEAL